MELKLNMKSELKMMSNANAIQQSNELSKEQDFYPAQYYLNLKSKNHDKWKERWECMLLEPRENYLHLPFEEFSLSEINDRGKFFKLNEGDSYNLIKASENEIEEASIWVLPGALSTSRYDLSLTLQDINVFFNKINYPLKESAVIFCPYSSGENRYTEAMEYNNNDQSKYYSVKIEKFVRKYLIPRIIKERKLTFIAYSIGGQELAMIENATRYILLNEYNYPITLIQKLFQSVSAICIGYATDIDNLPDLRFRKIVVLSASDQGLFIPQSLYYKLYKVSICNRPFTALKIDQYETLIFLGHQVSIEILDGKLNHDGHRLPHYLDAIVKTLPATIFKYIHSLIFDNSNAFDKLLERELDLLSEM